MNKIKIISAFTFLLFFSTHILKAQGCSDAGFCTIDSFKPNAKNGELTLKNQVKFGVFAGKAENSISVYGNYLEYNRQINENFGLDVKLTTLAQNGNGVSTFGLSDLFLNGNYRANEKVMLTLGVKIPLTDGNKTLNSAALPMDYQASLGTVDLVLGAGYQIKKLQLVAAIQQPITQNDNQYFATNYPINSDLRNFPSTNKFKRSGDVLLRASYPLIISEKIKITPSLLPIYHLSNDKFTDQFNIEQEILKSQGLTLNGNVYMDYQIDPKNSLQLSVGAPFVVRESRPDGLTRKFVANIEYRLKF